jgi:AcrR family transcriptional regulator
MRKSASKPRIRNPAQTRTRLLQATIRLVAEKGEEALSLKEAAELAQVSRTIVYQHFCDREDLLREAKSWLTERLVTAVAGLDDVSVEKHVQRISRVVLENPDASKLLLLDALANRDLKAHHPLHRAMRASLKRFKASGELRPDIDVDAMSFILLGTVATLLMMQRWAPGNPAALARRFGREWTCVLQKGIFAAR